MGNKGVRHHKAPINILQIPIYAVLSFIPKIVDISL